MGDKRNIVVGFDGTWNEPERQPDGTVTGTNVVKFLSALMKRGQPQHYESGAGTRAWEALPGGIYGYGLDKRIVGAYRFLRRCYAEENRSRDDNRLFILGFSRGSYAARRLSGLIAHSGIPVKASDAERGWQMYLNKDKTSAKALKEEGRFFDIDIEMVGVFDTVKATNDPNYNDKLLSPNVKAGYHAMAVDECRKFFPILRWKEDPRVKEVWFSGSHSDVGGGCVKMDLSDVALAWMIRCGAKHGLKFKKSYMEKHVNPKVPGHFHDSFTAMWKTYGKSHRKITQECAVHKSVAKQVKAAGDYVPDNLPPNPKYVAN